MATSEEALRDAWRQVAGPHRTAAIERLLGRYREPHRRYHTADHIATMLNALHEITAHCSPEAVPRDPEAVVLAMLFHDAVYDLAGSAAASNEQANAASIAAWYGGSPR